MRARYHSSARAELQTAYKWYNAQANGIGDRLLAEVQTAIIQIEKNPEAWPLYYQQFRKINLLRFPYGLAYKIIENEIQIYAFMHLRKRPGYWLKDK